MTATLAGFCHRMVRTGDVDIHAVTGGAGPPLVLIHGFPQTWWAWRTVMPRLAAAHSVVAIDLRGAGHSSKPLAGYDKASLAADVHDVMTALGFGRYAVCGHDIGAMVAVALASIHRDAVTHLAVMESPVPGWSQWEATASDPRLWHYAFHMKRDLPELLLRGREHDYVAAFIADRAFDQGIVSIGEYARALAQPGNTRGGLEWYRAFPIDNVNGLVWKRDALPMPVLALGGAHRFGAKMVKMMTEFVSDVSGAIIPDAAHWLPEENPGACADAILRFLAR